MNFVDFVVDRYSHITSHVSQAFASCTHNTSYSLLNIVHVIVCVFGLINQVWKILWVLCKNYLLLEKKKGEIVWNLNFGKTRFKICVLEKNFILYSMLWGMFSKNQVIFLKRCFFLDFWLIQSNFRSIEVLLKNFSEPLSGSIDRTDWSNLFFDQSNIVNPVFLK